MSYSVGGVCEEHWPRRLSMCCSFRLSPPRTV